MPQLSSLDPSLVFKLVNLVVTAAAMTLFLAIGAIWPRTRPAVDLKDTWINLLSGAMLFGLRSALLIGVGVLIERSAITGLIPMGWLAERPIAQVAVVFLSLDLARYWLHRAHHRVPILWKFHRTHHCSEHINATSGLRLNVVDMIQLAVVPVLLFEVVLDVSSFGAWVLPSVLLFGVVLDAFEHANLRMDMTKPWNRAWNLVLNNPHFHAWHHTREGKLKDGNYSLGLTVWDRLFGSDVTEPLPPEEYGIVAWDSLENTFLGVHLLQPREQKDPPA
jgi:sterol desaturase/sphingolipid hydroxylase (fatty acid hydroxylase superfamily)